MCLNYQRIGNSRSHGTGKKGSKGSSGVQLKMDVPGKVGWPVLGDKTIDFYRDPLKFLNKKISDTNSRIFCVRFLNKPTVFVCSNKGVADVLEDVDNSLELGYETFMGHMFEPNLLFTQNDFADDFRQALKLLFTPESMRTYTDIIQRILEKKISDVQHSSPICLYKLLKEIFIEMCLTLFLDLDFSESQEISQSIVGLARTHWHGIVAVPLEIKIPGIGKSSTYSKAIEAKSRLLEAIVRQRTKAKSGFPDRMKDIPALDDTAINSHLLLFTSALVPKVLSSICTSLCVEIGQLDKIALQAKAASDPSFLDNLLLETERLYPPLLGGRRVARKSCSVNGYTIPKDFAVVYMTQPAQRDPAVFEDPDSFSPERWEGMSEMKDNLFIFGMGRRRCIGQDLGMLMIKMTLNKFMEHFTWEICEEQDMTCKRIPVLRPRINLMAKLIPK